MIPRMEKKKDRSRQTSSNLPSHDVCLVREGLKEGEKGFWNRIGAAWPHKDGKGFNVVLDGNLALRERKPKDVVSSDVE